MTLHIYTHIYKKIYTYTIISYHTSQLKLQDLRHCNLFIFSYKPHFLFSSVCLNNFGLFKEHSAVAHYEHAVYLQFYISLSGVSWCEAWCKHVHRPCLLQEEIKTQNNFNKFYEALVGVDSIILRVRVVPESEHVLTTLYHMLFPLKTKQTNKQFICAGLRKAVICSKSFVVWMTEGLYGGMFQ